jgi:hypothetical protein
MNVRHCRIPALLIALATGLLNAGVLAQGVPSQLGLGDQEAGKNLLYSINSGSPNLGLAAKAFIALPVAARPAVVNATYLWIKTSVNSAAFKAAYAQARDQMKPTPPRFDGTVDDELKRQAAEQAKQSEASKKMIATLPADQRASMEAMMKQADAMANDPKAVAFKRQLIESQRAQAQQTYEADLKKWQNNYPTDLLVLVARRLQTFLTVTADIDFAAKTTPQGGHLVFVNPAYQSKSRDWHMCFRAGKEAVTAARAAATKWLAELPVSK